MKRGRKSGKTERASKEKGEREKARASPSQLLTSLPKEQGFENTFLARSLFSLSLSLSRFLLLLTRFSSQSRVFKALLLRLFCGRRSQIKQVEF